jgi:NADPH:quinone reductase-like Zn-dependent oxidoreductase
MSVRIMRSGVIDAPVETVWALLRDFNGHDRWHPAIARSAMEDGDLVDQVGGIRAFHLQDGGFLREQLIALSDRERSLSYGLLEAPLPLHDYVARMQLKPVTDGDRTLLVWESRFRPPPAQAAVLSDLVAQAIYEAGIAALQARFAPGAGQQVGLPPAVSLPPAGLSEAAGLSPATAIAATAIVVEVHGGPEVMGARTIEVPPPGMGQVRLRHTAIGVNFIDVHARAGHTGHIVPPGVPGVEAVGLVQDVGAGVAHLRPGDRAVYAGLPMGSYASYRTLAADMVIPLPPDIDDRVAAATFLKGLMTDALLEDVHPLRAGETMLVRAAAGGVGLLLCRIAKAKGARVVGVVSRAAKSSAALVAGCDLVIVTEQDDVAAMVERFSEGRGMDVVFDPIGRETIDSSLALLAVRGHLVSFGEVSGGIGDRSFDELARRSIRISRPNLAHFMRDRAEIERRAARLFGYLRQGLVQVSPTSFPLAEAARAHELLENRRSIGPIILLPT